MTQATLFTGAPMLVHFQRPDGTTAAFTAHSQRAVDQHIRHIATVGYTLLGTSTR